MWGLNCTGGGCGSQWGRYGLNQGNTLIIRFWTDLLAIVWVFSCMIKQMHLPMRQLCPKTGESPDKFFLDRRIGHCIGIQLYEDTGVLAKSLYMAEYRRVYWKFVSGQHQFKNMGKQFKIIN